ncbi:MAG: oligosaccharide flippase family protein [Candidatus Krumholzibacteria bacterium]|jgi:O-antigen/teichoic acid export membrane protein|nr:oligosaccharide flippase family protein [Candidatus Krumholzibacteria bacterium]
MNRTEFQSALLMAMGTVGLYLANLIFAKTLSPEAYGYFGLILVLPALAYSFGLLGTEQVLLRHGHPDGELVSFPAGLRRAEIQSGLLSSALLALFFAWKYPVPQWGILNSLLAYSLLAASSAWLLHQVSVLRLARRYDSAQWASQSWRILLPFAGLLMAWRNWTSPPHIVLAVLVSLLVSLFLSRLLTRLSGLGIELKREAVPFAGIWKESFYFSSSLLSLSLLAQMDRLILARTLGVESAGVYIFLFVVASGPFSLIQSYMGFTLLPKLRHRLAGESRNSILQRASLEAGLLAVLATACSLVLYLYLVKRSYDMVYHRDSLFALLLGLGWVRAFYGVLSARLSASASTKDLSSAAVYGWVLSLVALLAAVLWGGKSLLAMATLVPIAWLIRTFAWWRLARRAEESA